MIKFPVYAKIKDNYCICYFGSNDEFLYQLKVIRPFIERRFPGLNLHLSCRDDRVHIFDGHEKVMGFTTLKENKNNFAFIKELMLGSSGHPIENLLEECGIDNCDTPVVPSDSSKAVLVTNGSYPTMPLLSNEIEKWKRFLANEGFEVNVDGTIEEAGLVVGVESPQLYEAVSKGIPTRLIATGIGTRLYKSLCPNGKVLTK